MPRQSRCFLDPWRKDNFFGFFGVWHANREWTKYGVYSSNYHHIRIREHDEWKIDTGFVWCSPNFSDMINEGSMDEYNFIFFSGYME